MVSHMKVRNKSKKYTQVFCEKLAMEFLHSVYNAVYVNTACNNFIKIIDAQAHELWLHCFICELHFVKFTLCIFHKLIDILVYRCRVVQWLVDA